MVDILSMDSNNFYERYKNVLGKTELAPIFGQELAIRRNVSLAANKKLYNSVLDEIAALNPDKDKPALHNLSVIDGGAGTGKTAAVSAISAAMLAFDQGKSVEFVYMAPNEDQAKKLQDSVGIKGITMVADNLDEYYATKPEFSLVIKNGKPDDVSIKNGILNAKKLWNTDKPIKILIVDEFSLFNSPS